MPRGTGPTRAERGGRAGRGRDERPAEDSARREALEKLSRLFEAGVLTREQYESEHEKLLDEGLS